MVIPNPLLDKPPRQRRWIPLSARIFAALLVLLGLCGSLWFGLAVHRQGTVIREIERLGGRCELKPTGSDWFDRFVRRPLAEVTAVRISSTDKVGEITPHFQRLHPRPRLYVDGTQIHKLAKDGDTEKLAALLNQHPILIHACDSNDQTPLHLSNDERVVEEILKRHPDLSCCDARNETPLQRAVSQMEDARDVQERDKWLRITDLYLRYGAEYDLLTAIHLNDLDRVQAILKRSSEKANDFQSRSPLRTAAHLGRYEICRYLLETHHVDVNDFTRGNGYPIIKTCLANTRLVKLLIRNGADLQTRITWRGGRSGIWIIGDDATALHYAADYGVPETITLLLDSGVDIFATAHDMVDVNSQQTALEVAAFFGKAENARAIVNHPKFAVADRRLRQSVLDRSLWIGVFPSWLARDASRPQLVELLLDLGADPNAAQGGVTAMQAAAREIHPDSDDENAEIRRIVAFLAQHGAPIDLFSAVAIGDDAKVAQLLETDCALANSRGRDGYPALHFAVGMNAIAIAAALLKAGGDVDIRNESGYQGDTGETALHCAAFWGRYEIAKLLIGAGADVNAHAEPGTTPLDDALRMDNADLAQLLRENGAHEGNGRQ
jgi:ankyrin repeat protein